MKSAAFKTGPPRGAGTRASPRPRPASKRHLGALVLHALGLVVEAGQRPGLADRDRHPDPESRAQILGEPGTEVLALRARERRRRIDADKDVVEPLVTSEHDLELVHARVRPGRGPRAPPGGGGVGG